MDMPIMGSPVLHATSGKVMEVRKVRPGVYCLSLQGSPATRWGNASQMRYDIEHFEEHGALPSDYLKGWA